MARLQKHLRNTFLTGIFAATPLAVTAFVVWYVEVQTRQLFRVTIPFLGVILAIAGIYLLGLVVSSLIGQWLLRQLDRLLMKVPGLKDLYQAWKHVSLTPGGREGVFAQVVLIPGPGGDTKELGFTSGEPVPGNPEMICVFVPAAPNPMNGRLYLVPLAHCQRLQVTAEEAFKMILSTGNYVPPDVGRAGAGAAGTP